MPGPLGQRTLRGSQPGRRARKLYILVMGLTGAGKSTFISIITQNDNIPIGGAADLDGVTQEVQDYIFLYTPREIVYEIHFIDSPGFDDGSLLDSEVLSKIATFVNTTHKLKKRLAGVLYLHDITRAKVGGVARRNLRMLEEMIGMEKWSNCILVTTKWGVTSLEHERLREATLAKQDDLFGAMLNNTQKAKLVRFDPKDRATALKIIQPFLHSEFVPLLSEEMISQRLALGETSAGKVVATGLEELASANERLAEVNAGREILAQKFDEQLFQEFKERRTKLLRRIALQRTGRWLVRTTIIGGSIAATVLTAGAGASAFVLEPVFEKVARTQKNSEKAARQRLEQEFRERSVYGVKVRHKNSDWLWDYQVNDLHDLEQDCYSLANASDEDLKHAVRAGGRVDIEDVDQMSLALSELDSDASIDTDDIC